MLSKTRVSTFFFLFLDPGKIYFELKTHKCVVQDNKVQEYFIAQFVLQ